MKGLQLDSRTGTASTSRHVVYHGAGRLRGNDDFENLRGLGGSAGASEDIFDRDLHPAQVREA